MTELNSFQTRRLEKKLEEVKNGLEAIAREVFAAQKCETFVEVQGHLDTIIKLLGVTPEDVGM